MIIFHQHEISDRQNTIMPYIFVFWDFGRIMAVGHWAMSQNRDFRGFLSSPKEHNHALY
jgi:hypothetical protein